MLEKTNKRISADMEDILDYKTSLEEIGVDKILLSDVTKDKESQQTQMVFRSLYYLIEKESKTYKGPPSRDKESDLEESLLLLNSSSILDFVQRKDNSEIKTSDLGSLRKLMFKNLLGKYYYAELRRYKNRCGIYVTKDPLLIEKELEKQLNVLNRYSTNNIATNFLNAVDFLIEFIKLHPFEEGDGRVGRLIANYFLLNNKIRPVIITDNRAEMMKIIELFSFSEYKVGFVALTLANVVNERKDTEFIDRLSMLKTNNPYTREIKDLILIYLGKGAAVNFDDEIKYLYSLGVRSEHFLKAASWLTFLSKKDNELLSDIYKIGDNDTKALSLLVMEAIDNKKYGPVFLENLNSDNEKIRTVSVGILGRTNLIDNDIFTQILNNDASINVLINLGRAISKNVSDEKLINNLERLIEDQPIDVRIGGYYGIIRTHEDHKIVDILNSRINIEEGVVKKNIIEELSTTDKINNRQIAEIVERLANEDTEIRYTLLGELTRKPAINEIYLPLLEKLVKNGTSTEKTYATYLLGRERGSAFDAGNSRITTAENLAIGILTVKLSSIQMFDEEVTDYNKQQEGNFHLALDVQRHIGSGTIFDYSIPSDSNASIFVRKVFGVLVGRLRTANTVNISDSKSNGLIRKGTNRSKY